MMIYWRLSLYFVFYIACFKYNHTILFYHENCHEKSINDLVWIRFYTTKKENKYAYCTYCKNKLSNIAFYCLQVLIVLIFLY